MVLRVKRLFGEYYLRKIRCCTVFPLVESRRGANSYNVRGLVWLQRYFKVPCGGGNAPPCSPTGFFRYAFDG